MVQHRLVRNQLSHSWGPPEWNAYFFIWLRIRRAVTYDEAM